MLRFDRATTASITGQVIGGNISGWVLTLVGLPPRVDFLKSSVDPEQILILDAVAGTFIIYITEADTELDQTFEVELRAVNGPSRYLLAHELVMISG